MKFCLRWYCIKLLFSPLSSSQCMHSLNFIIQLAKSKSIRNYHSHNSKKNDFLIDCAVWTTFLLECSTYWMRGKYMILRVPCNKYHAKGPFKPNLLLEWPPRCSFSWWGSARVWSWGTGPPWTGPRWRFSGRRGCVGGGPPPAQRGAPAEPNSRAPANKPTKSES